MLSNKLISLLPIAIYFYVRILYFILNIFYTI